jgi:hypothetical protein
MVPFADAKRVREFPELRPPQPPDPLPFLFGLDLGQSMDHSALAIAEQSRPAGGKRSYAVRHLKLWPLGTGYPQVIGDLAGMLKRLPGPAVLVVDGGGPGRPVVDMLFEARLPCRVEPVITTAGHHATREKGYWCVPKRDVAGALQAALQTGRVAVAPKLKEAARLARELQAFRVKVNPETGHESFEALRERDHDDLVIAVALAVWYGESVPDIPDIFVVSLGPNAGPAPRPSPPELAHPELVRWFRPTGEFQPVPRVGGQPVLQCPGYKTEAEAAHFAAVLLRELGEPAPEVEADLTPEQCRRVEADVARLIRERRLEPVGARPG